MAAVKKKGNNNKAKGNTWERDICKFLGETLGGSFIRVPNSGAFIGASNASRKQYLSDGQIRTSKGDIIPPDYLPKLVIEAKSYKDFPFHQLMTPGDCKQLDEWISQTLDCVDPGDVWFTIFKINNKSSYVCFEKKLLVNFKVENHCLYKDYAIMEFKPFTTDNKDAIISLCS